MGRSIIYCPICGCNFEDYFTTSVEYEDDVLSSEQTKWLASFRVIGKAAFTEPGNNDDATFAVSPPASDAEFRSVRIAHTNPATSRWGCMNGSKWSVFDQNDDGVVLYPVHDACIFVLRKMASRNFQHAKPGSLAKYTNLESYYETLTHLHERLTEYPYEENSDQEEDPFAPSNYGRFNLEWEHGCYGAARCADGFGWDMEFCWDWICVDFIEILSLTSYILRHLQPLQVKSPQQPATVSYEITFTNDTVPVLPLKSMSSLESVPTEIINQIVYFLPATATLKMKRCSKALASKVSLDQIFWRNGLIAGDLVPWLWDLDVNDCHIKDRSGSWDWNQLAQMLRQAKIFESAFKQSMNGRDAAESERTIMESVHETDVTMSDAPLGLKNRCRLVELVRYIESR